MKTSSFWRYLEGDNRIAISRVIPPNLTPGFKRFMPLAPVGGWVTLPELKNNLPLYREYYEREILSKLDPQRTWDELHRLAGKEEPVLLCWEPLKKPGEWCHRRIAAEWFEKALGVEVAEYVPVEQDNSQLALL